MKSMKTDYAEFESDKYIMEKWFPNFTGTMVEVGAGLPEYISMSKFFRKKGWRTICIEPNPRYVQMYKDLGYEIYEYALSDKNEKDIDFEIYIEEKSFNEGVDGPFQGLSVSSLKARQHVEKCYTKHVIKVEVVTLNWLLESLNIKKTGCRSPNNNPKKYGIEIKNMDYSNFVITRGLYGDEAQKSFLYKHDKLSEKQLIDLRLKLLKYVKEFNLILNY